MGKPPASAPRQRGQKARLSRWVVWQGAHMVTARIFRSRFVARRWRENNRVCYPCLDVEFDKYDCRGFEGHACCNHAPPSAKKFRHKIFTLNPAGRFGDILGPGSRFNPLKILEKNWADVKRLRFLISDAQMLAKQLLPEPVKESSNTFFRNG
ncbi:MAG: hypothetical protein AAF199_00700 [Pseudomonadota bacterium]